ncbi:MAG TPA: type II secretion system protein N [Rhodoferax sp.]|nr:type II secretion system protein N [Rhodoferax sp.]
MPTISYDKWWAHGLTLLVWALAAASVVFWALKFVPAPRAPSAQPLQGTSVAADPQAVARLLGANLQGPAAATGGGESRYTLLGVVADRDHQGAALIAVDGKPPKPFLVGARVDDGLLLQSVAPRRALLGPSPDAPASVTLDLPAPTYADTAAPAAALSPAAAAAAPPATPAGPAIPPEQFIGRSPTGAAPSIRQRQNAHSPEAGR